MSSATGVVTTSDLEAVGVSAPDWIVTRLATDARLVASSGSNEELFLGIAPTSDVERYLEGAAHHQVVSVTSNNSNYRRVAGTAVLESPLDQSFWVSSAIGSDQPSVKWPVASGEWTVVLMNADGSADVNAGVTAGAKYGSVWMGALLVALCGVLLMVGALPVLVFGVNEEFGDSPSVGSLDITPAPPGAETPRARRRVLARRR